MVSPSLNVEFTCPLCGGHQLSLPEGYTDSSMATCGSCGTDMAPWGQIKAAATQQSRAQDRRSRACRRSRLAPQPLTGCSRPVARA